jgi:hypothetical protein
VVALVSVWVKTLRTRVREGWEATCGAVVRTSLMLPAKLTREVPGKTCACKTMGEQSKINIFKISQFINNNYNYNN